MSVKDLVPGKDVPHDVNAFIEITGGSSPAIKHELDKDTNVLFVDRLLHTSMVYPCHYGFIPHTLARDNDPLDIMVVCHAPLMPGVVIRSRPVGVLLMEDEKGPDEKVLAVPVSKVCPMYDHVKTQNDLPSLLLEQIVHFFTHYKDLEKGKWVKVGAWGDTAAAEDIIRQSVDRA